MKLELRENKILKINNPIIREIPLEEISSIDKYVNMMKNYVEIKGFKIIGPLIQYSSGIKGIDKDNKPIIENKIILQLHQSGIKVEEPYISKETIRIENCLFCRFNDIQDNLQYAISKITLHAYENDIILNGESYIVLIENKDNILLADVFMPIKKED